MTDRGPELQAVMESLADHLDEAAELAEFADTWEPPEYISAVAQILELTQLLLWEHQQVITQMNEFIGAMAIAKEEATRGTKLIVANAGEASRLIRGD